MPKDGTWNNMFRAHLVSHFDPLCFSHQVTKLLAQYLRPKPFFTASFRDHIQAVFTSLMAQFTCTLILIAVENFLLGFAGRGETRFSSKRSQDDLLSCRLSFATGAPVCPVGHVAF